MGMETGMIFREWEGMGISLFPENSRLRCRRIASSKATRTLVFQITEQLAVSAQKLRLQLLN